MGAPHVLSAHTVSAAVSRNRCRVMTTEWPATSTCGGSDVVAAHETPGPNAGSPRPRWPQASLMPQLGHEPASGRGVSQPRRRLPWHRWTSRTTPSEGRLDDSAIPPTVRRAPTGRAGHHLQPCNDPDRGERLGIHRGRASASRSHCGRASARRSHRGRASASRSAAGRRRGSYGGPAAGNVTARGHRLARHHRDSAARARASFPRMR